MRGNPSTAVAPLPFFGHDFTNITTMFLGAVTRLRFMRGAKVFLLSSNNDCNQGGQRGRG
jgi:hypothetical protein